MGSFVYSSIYEEQMLLINPVLCRQNSHGSLANSMDSVIRLHNGIYPCLFVRICKKTSEGLLLKPQEMSNLIIIPW